MTQKVAKLKGTEDAKDEKGQGRTVQSLERAFAIIEKIARSEHPLSLADISKAVGLHTSTTFHLLRTLCLIGCIRQDADRKYRIGPYIYGLAAGALTEINLVGDSLVRLEWLANETGETTHLAVMAANQAVIIARSEGTSSIRFTERVGSIRPAYSTAIGKVLLAHMSDARIEEYIRKTEFTPYTSKTIVDPERLWAEIQEIRRSGAAYDDCEFNAEIRCIAAPVWSYTGNVVAAIGASGPLWRVTLQQLPEIAKKVIEAGQELSRDLGYIGSEKPK